MCEEGTGREGEKQWERNDGILDQNSMAATDVMCS